MRVVYAQQTWQGYPKEYQSEDYKSFLFLVGPTPRSEVVPSWRPEALNLLSDMGYNGVVFVPEPQGGKWENNYLNQIDWEDAALKICANAQSGCIAAWVPRDLETMPAFTTNIEFGMYLRSGRMLYGRPPGAPKTHYLDHMYVKETKHGRESGPCESLAQLMGDCVEFLKDLSKI